MSLLSIVEQEWLMHCWPL